MTSKWLRDRLWEHDPFIAHALWHGLPLCGFTNEQPFRWPQGHRWIAAYLPNAAEVVNCGPCEEELKLWTTNPGKYQHRSSTPR